MRVRVGDIEGEILEITPTNVVVETDEGRAHIPARRFAEDVAVLLTGERDDG